MVSKDFLLVPLEKYISLATAQSFLLSAVRAARCFSPGASVSASALECSFKISLICLVIKFCFFYSGTSLLWTPLGQEKQCVLIREVSYFRGVGLKPLFKKNLPFKLNRLEKPVSQVHGDLVPLPSAVHDHVSGAIRRHLD